MEDCYFCGQIEGRRERDLIAQMLPGEQYIRRVMMETSSFAVIPSLGPLTQGHALLCPKAHLRSVAALGEADWAEFRAAKQGLRQVLADLHGCPVLLFEHGMSAHGSRIPCTVDHAHLHFVPLHGVPNLASVPLVRWQVFDGSRAELLHLAGGDEYLFVETPDGVARIATQGRLGFESQLMRKVIAEYIGEAARWSWRERPDPAAAHASWMRFTAATS